MKALARNINAAELVGEYKRATQFINEAYAILDRQEERLRQILNDDYVKVLPGRFGRYDVEQNREEIIEELRKKFWNAIIKRLKIRKILSMSRKEELDKQIDNGEFPEINVENVHGTIDALMEQASKFAEESIREVYDWLRPHQQRYVSNDKYRVEGRVIKPVIKWAFGLSVDTYYRQHVMQLDRVFHLLDGKAFLSTAVDCPLIKAIENSNGSGKTDYFKFNCFRNGNIHIWFLRDDLVDEFNRVAGGARLRE